jgi:hypothetical protein
MPGTGTVTEPSPPVVVVGSSGDTVTDVGGVEVVCSVVAVVVVVVVVVVSVPESSPPHPVASEPAATPAARVNRAESEKMRRIVMGAEWPAHSAAKR